jgi:hypothetical protein
MGTAYLTIIVLTAYYFLAFQPHTDPYLPRHVLPTPTDGIDDNHFPLRQQQDPRVEPTSDDGVPTYITTNNQVSSVFPTETGDTGEEWTANPIDVFILENKLSRWLLPRTKLCSETTNLHIKVERAFRRVCEI